MHPASKVLGPDPHFQVRGQGVTRVEAICDAMFGFGVTLLIVNATTGTSYDDLLHFLRGTPAFAFCFAILVRIWYSHYQFHRRFGLEDRPTIALNLTLMFVVLFFVFPLKLMIGYTTDFMFWALTHHGLPLKESGGSLKADQIAYLLEVFAGGFALVSLIMGLLYLRAYRLREALELDALEVSLTRLTIQEYWVVGGLFLLTAILLEWQGIRGLTLALVAQIVAMVLRRILHHRFRMTATSGLPPTAVGAGR